MPHMLDEHVPSAQVWVSWCDACGRPDYAFKEPPDRSAEGGDLVAGYPFCDTTSGFQKVAGPYTLKKQGRMQCGKNPALADVPNPIHAISDEALAAELKDLGQKWDELRSDDEGCGGGSPGERMVERIDELEREQDRRQRLRHFKHPAAAGVRGRR